MAIYKHSGSNNTQFVSFLNTNKNGTFLENAVISGSENFTITLNNCVFGINKLSGGEIANFTFNNGTINYKDFIGNQSGSAIINSAILSSNALIMSCIGNDNYIGIGVFVLTLDNNGGMALSRRKWNNSVITQSNLTNNFDFITSDAIDITTLPINTIYNLQKTSVFPVVIKTVSGKTTIPDLYVSIQNELPTDGTQAVSINDEIFITNGRVFVRGD